jgi:thioesterase domain-containing protein
MRAVASYSIKPVPVRVALFRPRLDIQFKLSGGRLVDAERNLLYTDNGWTPLVSSIVVQEVPGNHDSMVLEPNVRVLASTLRRVLAMSFVDSKQDASEKKL